MAVFLSFSTDSGFALLSTLRKLATLPLILVCIHTFEHLMWKWRNVLKNCRREIVAAIVSGLAKWRGKRTVVGGGTGEDSEMAHQCAVRRVGKQAPQSGKSLTKGHVAHVLSPAQARYTSNLQRRFPIRVENLWRILDTGLSPGIYELL